MIVAKIDKNHWAEEYEGIDLESNMGREFDYEAMIDWWGFIGDEQLPPESELQQLPHTRFKLYDDDGELYYEGWLYNDLGCLVQQFVLKWAEADSGCTTIKVQKPDLTWVQEIG